MRPLYLRGALRQPCGQQPPLESMSPKSPPASQLDPSALYSVLIRAPRAAQTPLKVAAPSASASLLALGTLVAPHLRVSATAELTTAGRGHEIRRPLGHG